MLPEINLKKNTLDKLFREFDQYPDGSEQKSYLTKLLCVLIFGYIEESIEILIKEKVLKDVSPELYTYVEYEIQKNFNSPSYNEIVKLIDAFNKEWHTKLTTLLGNNVHDISENLINIKNNRNNIAHGQDLSSSLTLNDLKLYYEKSWPIVDYVYQTLFE